MDGGGREHRTLGEGTLALLTRFAVPAPVRKPFRLLTRQLRGMIDGRIGAPRSATAWLHAGVLGGALAVAIIASGNVRAWTDSGLASAGLAITDVRLDGARETTDAAIGKRIGIDTTRSLPAVDVAASREALMGLPWVEEVEIEKTYPGTLSVRIGERQAVALWRVGARTLLLDGTGQPIVPSDGRNLPLLVGEGADAAMKDGLALFIAVPEVTKQIKALVRVGNRRWDMVTHRNVVVMLPEHGPDRALALLADLHRQNALLDQDLASIDLRVGDRIALRLPEAGTAARRERMDAAAERRRKTRKDREVSL